MVAIAERLAGPLRKPRTQKKSKPKKTAKHIWASAGISADISRRKPKSMELRFSNPILKVDIQSGEVLINRLDEYWAGENVVCRYDEGPRTAT